MSAAAPEVHAQFRPEIEGLRAVAVLLVVADHLWNAPRGGFLGVDIFFVISGYLITGLLQNEVERRGRISIRGFYVRRARRILPGALLVLATVVGMSQALLYSSRASQALTDVLWSAGFLANVHFAAIGTDYFHVDHSLSPVQHFWSLSVEEQFYVVWPLLLMGLWSLARRVRRRRPRVVMLAVCTALLAGVFSWSLRLTVANSATAYFSTAARAWELGVGAVLALASPWLHRVVPDRFRAVTVPLGLIVISVAVLMTGATRIPAPGALPAVAGAALVLAAGPRAGASRWAILLTNPAARYVGRISYSLYLWHWPVIVFAGVLEPKVSGWRDVSALLAMAALSVASFHLVEDPIRRSKGLRVIRGRVIRGREIRSRPVRSRPTRGRPHLAATLTAAVLAAAAFVAWTLRPVDVPKVFVATPLSAVQSGGAPRPAGEVIPPAKLASSIASALAATSFPDLTPSLGNLPDAVADEWTECGDVDGPQLPFCTFPATSKAGGSKRLVVLGDSYGISWLPALRAAQARGYTVYGMTYGECPAAEVTVSPAVGTARNFSALCDAHRDWAVRKIAALKPDVVVLASVDTAVDRLADGKHGAAALAEWRAGSERIAARVRAAGARRIVQLSAPPSTPSLQDCAPTPSSPPGNCVGEISSHWTSLVATERQAAAAGHFTYVDDHLLFCSANGYCPGFIGHTPVRADGLHLTNAYSESLATYLLPEVLGST